jgi:hypothetical protein
MGQNHAPMRQATMDHKAREHANNGGCMVGTAPYQFSSAV